MADGVDHIDIYADVGEEFNQVENCARPAFHGDVPSQKWHPGRGERPAASRGRAWLASAGLSAQGEAGAIVDCGAHQRPRATFPPGVWRGCTPAVPGGSHDRGAASYLECAFSPSPSLPPPLRLFPFLDEAPERWKTMSRRRSFLSPKTPRLVYSQSRRLAPLRKGKLESAAQKHGGLFLY